MNIIDFLCFLLFKICFRNKHCHINKRNMCFFNFSLITVNFLIIYENDRLLIHTGRVVQQKNI